MLNFKQGIIILNNYIHKRQVERKTKKNEFLNKVYHFAFDECVSCSLSPSL